MAFDNLFKKKSDAQNVSGDEVTNGSSDTATKENVMQYLADKADKLKQYFSDSQMMEKLGSVAKKIGVKLLYPVVLLYNLFKSPHISAKDKAMIITSLAYFILPVDLIPDFMLGVGFADDGIAIMKTLKGLSSSITPEIKEQSKAMCKDLIGDVDDVAVDAVMKTIDSDE